ncbi:MAG: hypothetical protein N3A53_01905 [Verrucomicrobiae bacterium]|nr:hypothetical protein [Verrucomicrobiae bacterium]
MKKFGKCCCCTCENTSYPVFTNCTVVPDYVTGSGYRPPYPRPSGNIACSDDCDEPGEPPCGPWTTDLPANPHDHNCYEPGGGEVEINCCGRRGWKAIRARKVWHGRFGFDNTDNCYEVLGEPGDGECNGCLFNELRLSPPTTKYLGKRAVVTYKLWDDGDDVAEIDIEIDSTVDKNSGVQEHTVCRGAYYLGEDETIVDWYDGRDAVTNMAAAFCNLEADCHGKLSLQYNPVTQPTLHMYFVAIRDGDPGGFFESLNADVDGTSINLSFVRRYSPTSYEEWNIEITLHTPYTSADVVNDVESLLSYYTLADHCQHPWRTDDECGLTPMVRRDEHVTPQAPQPYICAGGSTAEPPPKDAFPTGEIVGIPNPPGYGPHFQFRHENYTEIEPGVWCLESYGWQTPNPLPPNVTEWTTNLEAQTKRQGGWMEFSGGTLYAQKWAEIILPWPSMNFARPCGDDATLVDQDTIDCDTNPDGDLRWPDAPPCSGPWNSAAPRHNYVVKEWNFDFRRAGESQRLHDNWEMCYGNQCFPEPDIITDTITSLVCEDVTYRPASGNCVYVAAVSPNSESFANGTNHGWGTIVCDELYGSKWMKWIQQAMPDPLWQRPKLPCPDGTPDPEAVPPFVEARCQIPDGAPALPEGITIGCPDAEDSCPPAQAENCDLAHLHWSETEAMPPP